MGTPLWPSRRVRRHGDDDYPADRLLGVRKRNKATEYLVKWKGINPDTMTSLVGTMKHVSTLSRKIVICHTMSRPCRARVASVS